MLDGFLNCEPDWPALRDVCGGGDLLQVRSVAQLAQCCGGRLAYLATPYSKIVIDHQGKWNQGLSISAAIEAGCWLRDLAVVGVTATSPIILSACAVDSDPSQMVLDPLDADFWEKWCQPMLDACGSVIIPPIDGWDDSAGIWHEAVTALQMNVPVFLIDGDA